MIEESMKGGRVEGWKGGRVEGWKGGRAARYRKLMVAGRGNT